MSIRVRNRVPRWVAVAVPLIFCAGAAGCVAFYLPWITRPRIGPPAHPLPAVIGGGSEPRTWQNPGEPFVGHEERNVSAHFGPPTDRFGGHSGNPPLVYIRTYPEARTWVYERSGGRMYLSFCQQRGRWLCFRATWLPDGMTLD